MQKKSFVYLSLPVVTCVTLGCTSINPKLGMRDVNQHIHDRIQKNVHQYKNMTISKTSKQFYTNSNVPLTLDEIIEVALQNSSSIQLYLNELNISQSDLIQAKSIKNPILEAEVIFPTKKKIGKTEYEISLSQNIGDLFQRAARIKSAKGSIEKTKLHIINRILKRITEIKIAFYTYQCAIQKNTFQQSAYSTLEATLTLAKEQRKAGNINNLDISQYQKLFQIAKLDLDKDHAAMAIAKFKLINLIGLTNNTDTLSIVPTLPKLPREDPELKTLKSNVSQHNLDLAVSEKNILASKSNLVLAQSQWLPEFHLGVKSEWNSDGELFIGPTASIGLPFFGSNKAAVFRAKTELRKQRWEQNTVRSKAQTKLRLFYTELQLARKAVELYERSILPAEKKILDESLKHYNYMLLGNFHLLEAKKNQMLSKRDHIDALKEYWVARAKLEGLIGEKFSHVKQIIPKQATATEQSAPTHQH